MAHITQYRRYTLGEVLKLRWFLLITLLFISRQSFTIPLPSETLYFDMRALTMNIPRISADKNLEFTSSAIVDDDLGYLWIGTQDGLVRLDSYESKRFIAGSKSENSLVNNYIAALAFEPSQRRLWIGTANGLSVYDLNKQQFRNYRHDNYVRGSLSDNVVQTIFVDSSDRVWVGSKNGLNRYDHQVDSFESYFHDPQDSQSLSHSNILDIKEDGLGRIWVATQSGINRYDKHGKFSRFYPFKNDDGSYGLVTKIAISNENKLWLGTEQNGLILFDPGLGTSDFYVQRDSQRGLPSNYIRSLLMDSNGDLWVGTNAGIAIYDQERDALVRIDNDIRLTGNIVSLHQDAKDVVWIGSWSNGLHRYNPHEPQVGRLDLRTLKTEGAILTTFAEGLNDEIWFANQKSLYHMEPGSGTIEKYDISSINLAQNRAIPFFDYEKKSIYLLSDKIYEFVGDEGIVEHDLPVKIRNASWYSATMDKRGRLWLGSRSVGIYVLSPDFSDIVHHFQSAIAGYVRQVDDNTMLIGSLTATYWIDMNSFARVVHRPENTRGMLNPNVTGYVETSVGEKWLATSGGIHQLIRGDANKVFYNSWTTENGLPTDVITGPLEDNVGKLWFSSTNGLIRFDPRDKSILHFDDSQGALRNHYIGQYVKDSQQRMYFQGPRGLSIVDENLIKPNLNKYDVVIDKFWLQDTLQDPRISRKILTLPIQYTEAISLPPKNRDFTFGFSSTYAAQQQRVTFYYRLIGFDNKWLQTDYKNRQIKYTNLDPGYYRFEIYAKSPDGVMSDVRIMDVTIKPFLHETLLFKAAVISLIFLAFFAWYKYRMYKVRQHSYELEVKVEQRTRDIKTLANIAQDICFLLDTDELMQQIYRHLNNSLDVSVLAVGVYEPSKHRIKFEGSMENGKIMPTHYRPMKAKSQLAAWCIDNNQEIVLQSYEDRFKYLEESLSPVVGEEMETVVYIPVRSRTDEMLGCITVQSKEPNAYDREHLDFVRTISNYTGIALDNAITHTELKRVSSEDFLTNLLNRRAFLQQAQYHIKVIKRNARPLVFAMADLDNFKSFNDSYGHDCGDFVLCRAAEVFRESLREGDLVGRWGGEEFIFMFPDTDNEGANVVLNKLRTIIERTRFVFEGHELTVTSTFGYCSFSREVGIDETIKRADDSLYRGKQNGRNCVEGPSPNFS